MSYLSLSQRDSSWKVFLRSIAVIGAGAAGLMAAGQAASSGAVVSLYEQNNIAGKKLLLTGNGRCNVTNCVEEKIFLKAFNESAQSFFRHPFRAFNNEKLILFIKNELNVPLTEEHGGKIYPVSGRASDIRDAFLRWAVSKSVSFVPSVKITSLNIIDSSIKSIKTSVNEELFFDAVILANGGASYPTTGSDGNGYLLAKEAGHSVTAIYPALASLESTEKWVKSLQGIDLDDIVLTLCADGKALKSTRGDLLFAHFGITGPSAMDIAATYAENRGLAKGAYTLSIDALPDISPEEISEKLILQFDQSGKKRIDNILSLILPDRYAIELLKIANISESKLGHQISKDDRNKIVRLIKKMELSISGVKPLSIAMVTRGGVRLDEVEIRTMKSKIVNNLFFAGEILDIDGRTGGFNLQAAFSTGYVAGISAACIY
jgi:predicted Rossmann fold flavoprotein